MRSYPRPNIVLVFSLMTVLLIGLNSPAVAGPDTHQRHGTSPQVVQLFVAASAAALYKALTLLGQHRGSTPAQNQDIQVMLVEMQGGHRELTRLQKLTGLTALAVLKVCNRMPPWASQLTIMGMVQVVGHLNAAHRACGQAYDQLLSANPYN